VLKKEKIATFGKGLGQHFGALKIKSVRTNELREQARFAEKISVSIGYGTEILRCRIIDFLKIGTRNLGIGTFL